MKTFLDIQNYLCNYRKNLRLKIELEKKLCSNFYKNITSYAYINLINYFLLPSIAF